MNVSIGPPPNAEAALARLEHVLASLPQRIVACSGGIDSLLLATVAHRADAAGTIVAHTVTPAVPGDGTARVVEHARRSGWRLEIVRSGEFDDEQYLANPTDRCYHCKRNLYDAIAGIRSRGVCGTDTGTVTGTATDAVGESVPAETAVIVSGANVDDLGEYRPGLAAAAERDVRHPYVDASITKAEIRAVARHLGLAEADLPASPCLASRLYTGTRVTPSRLRAVEAGEALVRAATGIDVVRCRVRGNAVLVEVGDDDRRLVDGDLLASVAATMRSVEPGIATVELDREAYEPGRAVVGVR